MSVKLNVASSCSLSFRYVETVACPALRTMTSRRSHLWICIAGSVEAVEKKGKKDKEDPRDETGQGTVSAESETDRRNAFVGRKPKPATWFNVGLYPSGLSGSVV